MLRVIVIKSTTCFLLFHLFKPGNWQDRIFPSRLFSTGTDFSNTWKESGCFYHGWRQSIKGIWYLSSQLTARCWEREDSLSSYCLTATIGIQQPPFFCSPSGGCVWDASWWTVTEKKPNLKRSLCKLVYLKNDKKWRNAAKFKSGYFGLVTNYQKHY